MEYVCETCIGRAVCNTHICQVLKKARFKNDQTVIYWRWRGFSKHWRCFFLIGEFNMRNKFMAQTHLMKKVIKCRQKRSDRSSKRTGETRRREGIISEQQNQPVEVIWSVYHRKCHWALCQYPRPGNNKNFFNSLSTQKVQMTKNN